MRVFYSLALVAINLVMVSCASPPVIMREAKEVSVDQLLASPTRFDGTRVLVRGFFLQPMVGAIALYQNEPDYHHYRPESGVRLDVDNQKHNLMPFQLKRCLVEGTFHASRDPSVRDSLNGITRLELVE
jgi:hypothetical protein